MTAIAVLSKEAVPLFELIDAVLVHGVPDIGPIPTAMATYMYVRFRGGPTKIETDFRCAK